MAMSTDRVEFLLARRDNNKKLNPNSFSELCAETLGLTDGEIEQALTYEGLTVRCRPSQFARFVIRRMEVGHRVGSFTNGIREMKPKLIEDKPVPAFVDVAKRNRRDYEVA